MLTERVTVLPAAYPSPSPPRRTGEGNFGCASVLPAAASEWRQRVVHIAPATPTIQVDAPFARRRPYRRGRGRASSPSTVSIAVVGSGTRWAGAR